MTSYRQRDAQRAADGRRERAQAARTHLDRLKRIIALWEEGLSDTAIGQQLGWSHNTVFRYRKVLRLALGDRPRDVSGPKGRWSEHAAMHEEAP